MLQQIRQPIATATKNSWSALSEGPIVDNRSELASEFPPARLEVATDKSGKKMRMSKIKRHSQQTYKKRRKQVKSCDADLMTVKKFDNIMSKIECHPTVDEKQSQINGPNETVDTLEDQVDFEEELICQTCVEEDKDVWNIWRSKTSPDTLEDNA